MYSYMTDLSVYFTRAHSYFGAKLMSFYKELEVFRCILCVD